MVSRDWLDEICEVDPDYTDPVVVDEVVQKGSAFFADPQPSSADDFQLNDWVEATRTTGTFTKGTIGRVESFQERSDGKRFPMVAFREGEKPRSVPPTWLKLAQAPPDEGSLFWCGGQPRISVVDNHKSMVLNHDICGCPPHLSLDLLADAMSRVSSLGIDSTGWIDVAVKDSKEYHRLRRYEGMGKSRRITSQSLKPNEVSPKRDEIERARVVEAIALIVDYFSRNPDLLNEDFSASSITPPTRGWGL